MSLWNSGPKTLTVVLILRQVFHQLRNVSHLKFQISRKGSKMSSHIKYSLSYSLKTNTLKGKAALLMTADSTASFGFVLFCFSF